MRLYSCVKYFGYIFHSSLRFKNYILTYCHIINVDVLEAIRIDVGYVVFLKNVVLTLKYFLQTLRVKVVRFAARPIVSDLQVDIVVAGTTMFPTASTGPSPWGRGGVGGPRGRDEQFYRRRRCRAASHPQAEQHQHLLQPSATERDVQLGRGGVCQ